jgi:hypothetical protein
MMISRIDRACHRIKKCLNALSVQRGLAVISFDGTMDTAATDLLALPAD